jgi:hypothetical protein
MVRSQHPKQNYRDAQLIQSQVFQEMQGTVAQILNPPSEEFGHDQS